MYSPRHTNALPLRKLTMVGDGGVGKSAILASYVRKQYPEVYIPTVFENFHVTSTLPSGKQVQFALYGLSGQDSYDRLRPLHYPDTNVFLMCFPVAEVEVLSGVVVDCRSAFTNIKAKWIPEVTHYCPKVPIILVGTKSDLRENAEENGRPFISTEEFDRLREEIGAIAHYEVSAKAWTSQQMDDFFSEVAEVAMTGRSKRFSSSKKRSSGCMIM